MERRTRELKAGCKPKSNEFWIPEIVHYFKNHWATACAKRFIDAVLTSNHLGVILDKLLLSNDYDCSEVIKKLVQHGRNEQIDWLKRACRTIDSSALNAFACHTRVAVWTNIRPTDITAAKILLERSERFPLLLPLCICVCRIKSSDEIMLLWSVIEDHNFLFTMSNSLMTCMPHDFHDCYVCFFAILCSMSEEVIQSTLIAIQHASSQQRCKLSSSIRVCMESWWRDLGEVSEELNRSYAVLEPPTSENGNRWWRQFTGQWQKMSLRKQTQQYRLALRECKDQLKPRIVVVDRVLKNMFFSQARVLVEWGLPIYVVHQIMAEVCYFVNDLYNERYLIDVINNLAADLCTVRQMREKRLCAEKVQ